MTYRTMQGREIDLEKLMRQQELSPAIGNMKVNARGDELGPGGRNIMNTFLNLHQIEQQQIRLQKHLRQNHLNKKHQLLTPEKINQRYK